MFCRSIILLFSCVIFSDNHTLSVSKKMVEMCNNLKKKYAPKHTLCFYSNKYAPSKSTKWNHNNYLNYLILNFFLFINTLYILSFMLFNPKEHHNKQINEKYLAYSITPSISQNKNHPIIKGVVFFIFLIGVQYLVYSNIPLLYPVIFNVFNLYIASFVYLYIMISNNL